ncbi:hypothetical protein OB13_02560 [Pontibacter sp. HJ8]
MVNLVDLNSIGLDALLNALAHRVCDEFEERFMKNLPAFSAEPSAAPTPEEPWTTKQACKHLKVSVPTLRKMVESGAVIKLETEGVRGNRYLPSTLNQAFKPVKATR